MTAIDIFGLFFLVSSTLFFVLVCVQFFVFFFPQRVASRQALRFFGKKGLVVESEKFGQVDDVNIGNVALFEVVDPKYVEHFTILSQIESRGLSGKVDPIALEVRLENSAHSHQARKSLNLISMFNMNLSQDNVARPDVAIYGAGY